jgi:hypothetical protein
LERSTRITVQEAVNSPSVGVIIGGGSTVSGAVGSAVGGAVGDGDVMDGRLRRTKATDGGGVLYGGGATERDHFDLSQ